MTRKEENPQAFPMSAKDQQGMISCSSSQGMTLRDYFAGQVLSTVFTTYYENAQSDHMAKAAYHLADAMLKERVK